MKGVLSLFGLRLRLLINRSRVGSSASRTGILLLRVASYLMGLAFLRFGALVVAETARGAHQRFGPPAVEFFFGATTLVAFAIIFIVNLLVFASEEFDVSDSTRDTAFLLSQPLTLRQVVWAKSLIRSTLDVYGVFLLVPLLWSMVLAHPGSRLSLVVVALQFLLVELTAILAAMAAFIWTARLVPYHRLETIRMALGIVLPSLASGAMVLLRESVATGALERWRIQWGALVSWTPPAFLVRAVMDLGGGRGSAAVADILGGLVAFTLVALLCDFAITAPRHTLSRLYEGFGRTRPVRTFHELLVTTRNPLMLLVTKDLVLLWRRPVFVLTTVLFPLGITAMNLLSMTLRGREGRTGKAVELLTHASVYVMLIILPYLGAAQSFGQTEHGRLPLLQSLPMSMTRVLSAKVILFLPLVLACTLSLQVVGQLTFLTPSAGGLGLDLVWTTVAAILATHVAVASAALFPFFEFGALAVRGMNMAIGGMLHFTVTAAIGLLVFPLRLANKMVILSLMVPMVVYLWRQGAMRLAYADEEGTLGKNPRPRWDEAYILFGLYASLQIVFYVSLMFVTDVGPRRLMAASMGFASLSLVALGVAAWMYLGSKRMPPAEALGLQWRGAAGSVRLGVGAGLVAALVLPLLGRAMGLHASGGPHEQILKAAEPLVMGLLALQAVMLAPVAEELFFRGVLLSAAADQFGRSFAITATSLLFALLHLDRTIPLMVLFGILQAWLTLRQGSLIVAVACHGTLNATGLLLYMLR